MSDTSEKLIELKRSAPTTKLVYADWKLDHPVQTVQTNADRIRSMSDEELGLFLAEWAEKPWAWKRDGEGECLAWLKEPYKEEEKA